MRIRRRMRGLGWGALLATILSPSIAEAQLFPNLPTHKRARIDCAEELPVYGMYRHKYYGYFPTCWRQFPPGWGCPSTESPDWQAELARQPLDIPDDDMPGLGPGPDGLGPDPFRGSGLDEMLPDLPRQRSPFDLDQPGEGPSPFDPPRRAPSPFESDPFRADPAEPSTGAPPDRLAPPASPFDFPGTSSAPTDLPSLAPPVTESSLESGDPIASLPQLPNSAELAVMPDSRPRAIHLPVSSGSAPILGASAPIAVENTLDDPQMIPHPMHDAPPAGPTMIHAEDINGNPVRIHPHSDNIIISEPHYAPADSMEMAPSESRPRRRILSSLFGRGN